MPDLLLKASQGHTGCVVGRIDDDVIGHVTIFDKSEPFPLHYGHKLLLINYSGQSW